MGWRNDLTSFLFYTLTYSHVGNIDCLISYSCGEHWLPCDCFVLCSWELSEKMQEAKKERVMQKIGLEAKLKKWFTGWMTAHFEDSCSVSWGGRRRPSCHVFERTCLMLNPETDHITLFGCLSCNVSSPWRISGTYINLGNACMTISTWMLNAHAVLANSPRCFKICPKGTIVIKTNFETTNRVSECIYIW